jgi:hypothetical protein
MLPVRDRHAIGHAIKVLNGKTLTAGRRSRQLVGDTNDHNLRVGARPPWLS